jgi:MinD-like ATPase involved in chromosome partitioning or flagellar assembly
VDQARYNYPPGTVGYLAQGLGWGERASATTPTEAEADEPPDESDRPSVDDRTDRPDLPTVPEQQTRSPAETGPDVHTGTTGPEVHTEEDDFVVTGWFTPGRDLSTPFQPAASDELASGHEPPASDELAEGHEPGASDELADGHELVAGDEPDHPAEPSGVADDVSAPDRDDRVPSDEWAGGYREPLVASWPEPEDSVPQPHPTPQPEPNPQRRPMARWVEPGAVAAQQAQRARTGQLMGDAAGGSGTTRSGRRPPVSGWRRAVYALTGGLVNLGESPSDRRRRELTARINHPLQGCYKIAMLSLKGGVGKTTVTATLGATFASLRGDRVIAVDANPDRGTLSQKIPLETTATVRHLLRDAQRIRRYTDVRAYTSQGPSRLEVLASEQDPAVSEAFSEQDYRRTVTLLEHFYNIVLTDCGTGLMHSAMYGVLGLADSLVIVSSGSIDGARGASATMDWLDAHGHGDLVKNSVAVINSVRRSAGHVDLDRVAEHFAQRCRAVVRIPFDSHLEEGAELDLDRLSPATRTALLELAATVADVFPHPVD